MVAKKSHVRWSVEQRLEFIEFCLFWEGGINRSDLIKFFNISVPQASKDLSQYQELAQENICYDKSVKKYFPSKEFKPKFFTPDSDEYLRQLYLEQDNKASVFPYVDVMPIPYRRIDSSILQRIINTIREQASIEILYQSMNDQKPDPIWRRITPHAFGSDGLRWHTRAFCHDDKKFKDFILSRTLDVRNPEATNVSRQQDSEWNDTFEVVLIPNPKLGDNQQKIIAHDYNMEDGCSRINIRRALLYYFRKRLRLDIAEALDNPKEAPVIIKNREKFEAAIIGS
ncbi:MAG: WYL domain-containing protein [Alphaproteobacteria bacterium]